jgi:hypothetical protein
LVCEYLLDPHGNTELCVQTARFLYGVAHGIDKRDLYVDTVWNNVVDDVMVAVNVTSSSIPFVLYHLFIILIL